RSSDITSAAPTSSDTPTRSPLLHGPAPRYCALPSAGSTSEKLAAASMIPAPKPSIVSCRRRLSARANNAGNVPSTVAPAAIEPARSAARTVSPVAIVCTSGLELPPAAEDPPHRRQAGHQEAEDGRDADPHRHVGRAV